MSYQKLLYYAKNNHIPIHIVYAGHKTDSLHWLKNLSQKTEGTFSIYQNNQTIVSIYNHFTSKQSLYLRNSLSKSKEN